MVSSMSSSKPGRPLKTLNTAMEILDTIQHLNGATVDEVMKHQDLARSTVHGYLSTLEEGGYLVREDKQYSIGLELLNKGGHARNRNPAYERVISGVDRLADRTDERVQFVVEESGYGYYIHVSTGDDAIMVDAHIGKRVHLHVSSAGKAILAALPTDQVEAILDKRGLPAYTSRTIESRAELYENLETVRDRGYSTSNEESIERLRAIAMPVRSADKTAIGAVSISAPAHRFNESFEQRASEKLREVIDEIELDIRYQ